MALVPGSKLGAYEVLSLIGSGGMGEVYRARDPRLQRDVALKVLPDLFAQDPDRLARFQREAQVLASLNHPNIAAIYGVEESKGVRALVLELVEGPTLADRLAKGAIPLDEALPIARQIAEALEAAHEHGVIHRDLKPANVKVRPDATVKVLDFGLAKLAQASGPGTQASGTDATASPTITSPAMITGAGVILGTAAYMAPEQAKGREADRRSDLWAFGCVLYEMLTGRRPFQGDDVSDTLAAILRGEPDWSALPGATPASIRTMLRRCLEKDVRKRWQAAGDLRVELEAALAEPQGIHTQAASLTPRQPAWTIAALALLGLLFSAAVGAAVMWTLRPSVPSEMTTRFSFTPPEGQIAGATNQLVAVSPDGASVAYAVNNRLYLRRMEDLESRLMLETDRPLFIVSNPFFSPDGQSVGFWSVGGSLSKIATSGGGALSEASIPYGASWEGDTIVFGQAGAGILEVPASGGTPKVWVQTAPDETAASPQVLPDGTAVLFTVTKATGAARWDSADIAVAVRDSGQRKVLIRGGRAARYVPTGHIVYAVDRNLVAVPFDLERLEVTGGPVTVVEGVTRAPTFQDSPDAANYSVSNNGTLVYIRGPAGGAAMRTLVWIDRQGREEPVSVPPRNFDQPRVSPDAQRVAVHVGAEGSDIWTFDLSRGALMRQTFEAEEDETPMWSPDGQWIAYASTRGSQRTVFRRRADGSGAEETLSSAPLPTHNHVEDWSSDGRMLLIGTAEALTGQADLTVLPIDGDRTPKPLLRTRFSESRARVSPDGRWVAYVSDESGRGEVYVQAFPSLQGKWQVSTGGGVQPVWSRQGSELFYRGQGSLMSVGISSAASFSPGVPRKLFDDRFYGSYTPAGEGGHTNYDVSPDGRRFLMVKDVADDQTSVAPQIVVVQNWFEELRRLVPRN